MPYPLFDRTRLKLKPLSEREHDMALAEVLNLDYDSPPFENPDLQHPEAIDRYCSCAMLGQSCRGSAHQAKQVAVIPSSCTARYKNSVLHHQCNRGNNRCWDL